MKAKVTILVFVLMLKAINVLALSGTGTSSNPYLISTASDLVTFRNYVNNGSSQICGKLMSDINLSSLGNWVPIGNGNPVNGSGYLYSGTFDGNNHTINGLYISVSNSDSGRKGLFGTITGTVRNLTVSGNIIVSTNSSNSGKGSIGGIVGLNYCGNIIGCTNKCAITGQFFGGGVAGNNCGKITDCINEGELSSSYGGALGGIAGECVPRWISITQNIVIERCTNKAKIISTSSFQYIGGIVGQSDLIGTSYKVQIKECNNIGEVSGLSGSSGSAGGIIGSPVGSYQIDQCENKGSISATYVGGIVGQSSGTGTISNSINRGLIVANKDIFFNAEAGGIVARLQDEVTYNDITYSFTHTIKKCCNLGTILSDRDSGSILCTAYSNNYTISQCYTNISSINTYGGSYMNELDFKSGKVTYLLQIGQSNQYWGQSIGSDDYPILSTDTEKKVYKTSFKFNGQIVFEKYRNEQFVESSFPTKAELETAGINGICTYYCDNNLINLGDTYPRDIVVVIKSIPIIVFSDSNVKTLCIANWDSDNDGELSEEEAAVVTDLGSVFNGNDNITSFDELRYFTGLTSIGDYTFRDCSSLISITIPNSVTSIGNYAFSSCYGLTEVTIPNSVTSIGESAFYGCSSLTSVTIPNSVTSIGDLAFSGCSGLTSIIVESGNTKYDSRNNCNAIIETSTNTLIIGCKNTVIPNSVTSIGGYAFDCCSGLTSVTIPNSVTSIGIYAFSGCYGLTSVTVEWASPISINSNTFSNYGNATLYVPYGSKPAYENADHWKEFKEIIEIDNRSEQSLELVALPTLTYGDAAYNLPAKTSEGLSLAWSVGNEAIATISGNILTIKKAGTTKVTATQEGDNTYKPFEKEFTLTINKAALTIKANDITMTEGDEIPELTVSYEGFKYNDNASSLTNQPTVSTTASSSSPVGTYPITVSGAASDNYSFTYINGTLTVVAREYGDPTANTLQLTNVEGYKGKQVELPISLNNQHDITAFQFDLYLPTGVTVAKKSNGKMMIETTERMEGSYTISSNTIDNFVRVAGYSGEGDFFTGNSGDILKVTLDIAETVADGDYTISLKEIVLSDVNNTEYHPANAEGTLTVKSYTLGDVDNSGAVNINDVVCIINHILNKPVTTFIAEAADVDGSGTININDVVTLINRFILNKDNAPAMAEVYAAPRQEVSVADNYLHLANIEINPGETKEVEMLMTNANTVAALQGNIKLPAGLSFVTKGNGKVDAKNIDARSEDFTLSCAIQGDGSLTFAQYSGDGFTYEGSSGGIFTFKIKAAEDATAGTYSVALSEVVLSINGVGYDIPDRTSSLTVLGASGISSIDNGELTIDNYYTLDGRMLQGKPTQKGVYIVGGRKVVIK